MKPSVAMLAIAACALWVYTAPADGQSLVPQTPVPIPGRGRKVRFHSLRRRSEPRDCDHPGAKELTILDVKSGTVTSIATGRVNGCGIDVPDNRYYCAGANQDVWVIDRTTLKKIADIPMGGPCDDVLYETKNAMVYVANDDGTKDWVINPQTNKVVASVLNRRRARGDGVRSGDRQDLPEHQAGE